MNPDLAPVQFRLAGALLRHHRETARWTLEEAAAELGCDKSRISRIETGHRRPVPRDIRQLLAAYGVAERERQAITALVQTARTGWWQEYRGFLPDAMTERAMAESAAAEILAWEPQALPAFLQTRGYAQAIAEADPALQAGEDRRLAVALSAKRAASLRDQQQHAAVTVILGEGALRQQVGGSKVMADQLRRIAGETAEPPVPVTLHVVPFTAGAHPAIGTGPVSVIRFRDVPGIGAICHGRNDGVSVAGQDELTAAVRRFEALRAAALSPAESLQFIREVAGTRR